ncbi:MAG: AMP-binding protein [Lachnospiraceae bacterium]|nr:AMP-binding protein [Lachnospiraceae bacterium]
MQRTNVLSYLEDNIASCSDKLSFCSDERQMTFKEVYDESRSIGSLLCKKGYSNEPVVVFMPKKPETVTAFFGVIYSGNFYVPIDSEMPDFRIRLILKNLSPKVILTDKVTLPEVEKCEFSGEILLYEDISKEGEDTDALALVRERQLDTDPIYVVFTSGSTGIPKGVVANHRSVIDYVENLSEELHFSSETIFGSQTPLYFDACLKELYPTLKFGACTWLIPRNLFSFPIKLVEYLNEHKINTICWVVSALTMISSMKTFEKVVPEYLTNIAFGSEVFLIKQFELWRNALPTASFTNLYGPTEATGMSCFFHVDRERHFEPDEPIPIGRPFKNTEIMLLSEDGKLVDKGETG